MAKANRYQKMTIEQLDRELINACQNGDIEIVKYILTSPDLNQNSNINTLSNNAVSFARLKDHFEVFAYLLSSPLFDKNTYDYSSDFNHCCRRNKTKFIDYFIFDYKIEKTDEINNFIISYKIEGVLEKFKARDLNETLEKSLDKKVVINKKIKI